MAVGPRLRFQVFARDGFRCRYCGRSADEGIYLQADHLHPRSKGGLDVLDNLVTACFECNSGKSDRVLRPIRRRGRQPRAVSVMPIVAEPVEPEPIYEIGSHCNTPLKIAAMGHQMRFSSYAAAHRYFKSSVPEAHWPPLRKTDAAWWRYCDLNHEPQRMLAEALEAAILGARQT